MIDKNSIDRIPSTIRDEIVAYLTTAKDTATREATDHASAYLMSSDEAQRGAALMAKGEAEAYAKLLKIFK